MNGSAIEHILILGAGNCGQQIALQFARFGFSVTLFDHVQVALTRCQQRQRQMLQTLAARQAVAELPDELMKRIRYTTDASLAAAQVDLVIESVPEDLALKRSLFAQFHPLCPPAAIFVTNSSYLLPSSLAKASGRPERFAAFHFHVPVWFANCIDVMPHAGTLPDVTDALCDLAVQIGQTPIRCRKENPGYVFNSLLHPLLLNALDLVARGVAEHQDVDRAWMAVTKMPVGPFGIIDQIGLDTIHSILSHWGRWLPGKQSQHASLVLESYLERHWHGEKSGRGFYHYPDPAFGAPGFVDGRGVDGLEREKVMPVTERFVPRVVAQSWGGNELPRLRLTAAAAIYGQGAAADYLAAQLCEQRIAVVRVPDTLTTEELSDWVEHVWKVQPCLHLFLVGMEREERGALRETPYAGYLRWVEKPFVLTQAWYRLLRTSSAAREASLLAICRLGGHLGYGAGVSCPEQGGWPGLVKSVLKESVANAGMCIAAKVVDLGDEVTFGDGVHLALSELAAEVANQQSGRLRPLEGRPLDLEVCYINRQRYVICSEPVTTHQSLPTPATLPSGSWLVSGGGCGITMQVALALARKYHLKLHLLGRTEISETDYLNWKEEELTAFRQDVMRVAYQNGCLPNQAWQPYARAIEVQKTLRHFQRAGVASEYHVCDVANRDAVSRVVAQLRSRSEPIMGVLHGAGVERSLKLETKPIDVIRNTLLPKTLGTQLLMELTRDEPLKWFIAFGSLSGCFGAAGQADYAMANEAMAKHVTALGQQRSDCRCLTVHWPAWESVGMAAQPENHYQLKQTAHHVMPVREGIEHLLREIEIGAPHPELIIVSPDEIPAASLVASTSTCRLSSVGASGANVS